MGIEEQLGEIVIAPRVLEKIMLLQLRKLKRTLFFKQIRYLTPFQNFLLVVAYI